MREVMIRFADADMRIQVTAIAVDDLEQNIREAAQHNAESTALELMFLGGIIVERNMIEEVLAMEGEDVN